MDITAMQHPTRALVLGGGGSTGNAWLIGVLAGLSKEGFDVTSADLTIGTSAGSTAAAQVAGTPPADLFQAILDAIPPQRPAASQGGLAGPVTSHLERTQAIIDSATDPAHMRRRMGAAAIELDDASDGSWHAQWRATVAARLASHRWPQHWLQITAVQARSGEPVIFDRNGVVELVDAIAASCSGRIFYRIADQLYIDGGYRRNENADLAAGHDRVLVLSPFGGRSLHPVHWRMDLSAQIQELHASGSQVETISPKSTAMFGANAMDLSLRPAAARDGYEQGRASAESVAEFWL